MMTVFLLAIFALSSVATLVISAVRLYLDWKRSKNTAWETAIRLMSSDPDFRCRCDDFAELYTALAFLEEHPDYWKTRDSLTQAIHDAKQRESR